MQSTRHPLPLSAAPLPTGCCGSASVERERRASAAERYLAASAIWPEGEREKLWASVDAILGTPEFASLFSPSSRAESQYGPGGAGETERAISGNRPADRHGQRTHHRLQDQPAAAVVRWELRKGT